MKLTEEDRKAGIASKAMHLMPFYCYLIVIVISSY